MANCEKCGNTYYSKECPHCKRITWERNLNKNNKTIYKNEKQTKPENKNYSNNINNKNSNKTILIIIAIGVSIIAFLLIAKEYRRIQEERALARMFYGTDDIDKIEKINKKIEKQTEKQMEEFRKVFLPKK